MDLSNPRNVPGGVLKRELFTGISSSIMSFNLDLDLPYSTFDLSDDFFQDFKTLRRLWLNFTTTRIPSSLQIPKNLTTLHIIRARISEITPEQFSNLSALESLEILHVPAVRIAPRSFANLRRLSTLKLSGMKATEIPAEIFLGLKILKVLKVSHWLDLKTIDPNTFVHTPYMAFLTLDSLPKLQDLPRGLFSSFKHARSIDITRCALKRIPTDIWPSRERIDPRVSKRRPFREYNSTRLNLAGNLIESISSNDLSNLTYLTHLDLGNNRIKLIENGAFDKLELLRTIILSGNQLVSFGSSRALISARNQHIEKLILRNNRIEAFPNISFSKLAKFGVLDLSDNLIDEFTVPLFMSVNTTVLLKNNRLRLVTMRHFEGRANDSHIFFIDNNPFQCDGHNYDFLSYLHGMSSEVADFRKLGNCFCENTTETLLDVNIRDLSIRLESCTDEESCECLRFPWNKTTSVRCRHGGLERVPDLPLGVTDLDFEGNALTVYPEGIRRYPELRFVNLKHNQLWNIDKVFSSAPPNLEELHLEFNKLERLNVDSQNIIDFSMALSDNPWICDCRMRNFKWFLDANPGKILEPSEIKCESALKIDGREESVMKNIPWDVICPDETVWILASSYIVVFLLLMTAIVSYFKHRYLITAFMYIHLNWLFRCLSNGEETEESRKFDAFLSYHTDDREMAMEILRELESDVAVHDALRRERDAGVGPFELAIHERDFVAGKELTWNINELVKNSHRSIIIMSEKFLDSRWFSIEFLAAYGQTLEDHVNRLIIIIKGDLPSDEGLSERFDRQLCETLKGVLKNRLYLTWGERWFWEKLLYAMPHGRSAKLRK
ncbi:protein toll-like [Galendromus occidentalis]|uniref:Protein toll-like n=1 Tax=Galendromus occidentalis TaxID=34638 RepID=A0AAJ6QT85_9ACAR|nr:protein toll-like [Galendromus occidentalis]